MGLRPWELAAYTLRELFIAYDAWREVHVHDQWERVRVMCYWMGNHKASKPDELFPLEIDQIRLKQFVESGRNEVRIRKQTDEERKLLEELKRGR